MAANWMRRTFVAAACASAALLAACGSSSTESAISPQRFIAFGDGLADVGQKGSSYTINDGSINNWMLRISSNYGGTLKPVSAGGLSYAQGNARVTATPDAAGNAATPTVTQQIDQFLAANKFADTDLVMLSAGASDGNSTVRALRGSAPSGVNLVICFHERARASANTSSRSPGLPMRSAASMACCSSGICVIAVSATPAACSARAMIRGTSSPSRPRRLSSRLTT